VDLLLHAGFARPYRPAEEIARSLSFTRELFQYAEAHRVPALINISSQSVYGQTSKPPWDERTQPAPRSAYAAAKLAAEEMLRSARKKEPYLYWTSLRLAGLTGGAPGLVPVDLVTRFVAQALEGEPLRILGNHRFERLDVRDAVQAIIQFLETDPRQWDAVYNLGRGSTITIQELARTVIEQAVASTGKDRVPVITDIKDPPLEFGMDSSRFYALTGWQPAYPLEDSIQSIINLVQDHPDFLVESE
jgi:nucleoside-diphosphate-sugar epimerase